MYRCPRARVPSSAQSSSLRSISLCCSTIAATRCRSPSRHIGLRLRPCCTLPARIRRCQANSMRTRHPASPAHTDIPSGANLSRRASNSWLMLTCLTAPGVCSLAQLCSCFQKATRSIILYPHSHTYCLRTGMGAACAACHRPSHLAAPALTSSTTSRHALSSTLRVPLPASI